ncbi:MARVEL domain-containing protein [Rhodotorula paludigena]|uniref:MARVEL domain-containing protein n=1 Tax=Rhodotorula paludigena TaxID=86838 RepID=UPI00317C9ECD
MGLLDRVPGLSTLAASTGMTKSHSGAFSAVGIEGKADGEVLTGERGAARGGGTRRITPGGLFDDDDGSSPIGTVLRILETLFPFVLLCIFIAQASFQNKWDVGVSGRVGLSLVVAIEALLHGGLVLATFMLADKIRFLRPLERGLKQVRIAVILNAFQAALQLVLALVTTISANVGGCKDASKDAHAETEGYTDTLGGFCRDKRAGAAFFWLNFFAWTGSLALTLLVFYNIRRNPRTTGFVPPGASGVGAQFPQDDEEAWARPSFEGGYAPPGAAGMTDLGGYRQSHDGQRLFDEPGTASGYGRVGGGAGGAGAMDQGVRDPFADQGYDDLHGGGHGGAYGGMDDPYEAIRKSMDVHRPQQY